MKITVILVLFFIIQGCSNRAFYNVIQARERQHCNEVPQSEQQDCRNRQNDSYDEYQRKKSNE